ncbi:hemolysin family protein [Pararhizobium mangrovi]|uniref:HlyC/CorC family transporter n=1 Tax=Pararhizobium mangrovi TaxID=2590452 RepID=A0A506U3C2_9HYPH|nr:hemolysin family protein [Pararhizobium mangrovi]TPW28330.1 HlyC/CorC family transporter [Pararhizobium mangrovi]
MTDQSTSPERPDSAPPRESSETDGEDESRAEAQERLKERAHPSFIGRLLKGLRPNAHGSLREDLADALRTDENLNAAFSPEERAMLHNILRLREVRVEDVMVPRADVDAADETTSIGDLMVFFEETGRSRMPVYRENLDDPRGMVHIRDTLSFVTRQARSGAAADAGGAEAAGDGASAKEEHVHPAGARTNGNGGRRKTGPFDFSRVPFDASIHEAGIVRDVLFVPPSMLAADLMERMQANRTQMALVIDEYGGTDGLVSLEDIVEMVVGDIEDEHDQEPTYITRTSDDVFLADARVDLAELAEIVGDDFDISEPYAEVDTLGGLLFSELGRVPARGEVVQAIPGFEFHVLDADPRRVKRVRIVRGRLLARRRPASRREGGEPNSDKA